MPDTLLAPALINLTSYFTLKDTGSRAAKHHLPVGKLGCERMSSAQIQCSLTKSWWMVMCFLGNIKLKPVKCSKDFRWLDQIPIVRYRQNLDQENWLSNPNSFNLPKSRVPLSRHPGQTRPGDRGQALIRLSSALPAGGEQRCSRADSPQPTLTSQRNRLGLPHLRLEWPDSPQPESSWLRPESFSSWPKSLGIPIPTSMLPSTLSNKTFCNDGIVIAALLNMHTLNF